MKNIILIATREFTIRVRKKSFPITIVILAAMLLVVVYLPTIIGFFAKGSQTKIAVINQTNQSSFGGQELKSFLDYSLNTTLDAKGVPQPAKVGKKPPYDINFVQPSETEALRQKVRDSKLDGLLTISRDSTNELKFDFYTNKTSRDTVVQRISDIMSRLTISDRLSRAGVQSQQAANIFAPAKFSLTDTEKEKNDKKGIGGDNYDAAASYGLTFFMVIALFTSINAFGSIIAQGVAEEKSNRIMEIMITAAKPFELLFGKVIGIGLIGIVSILAVVAVGVPAILLQSTVSEALLGDSSPTSFSLAGASLGLVGMFVVYYLLGYFLYATIYAGVGSLCSRIEDVQQALAPITVLQLVAYFIAIFGLQAIDAPWVVVASFVPFFSPILMIARLGIGTVSPLEIVISLVVTALSIVVCTWLAARLYKVGVLLYGKRPGMWQALGFGSISK